jgi:DNA polymerase-3 subunit epsilon
VQAATYAVVDVETTGLDPERDRVLEVAVVRITPWGVTTAEYSTLIRPDGPVPEPGPDADPEAAAVAAAIHGISTDELGEAPTFRQVAAALAARLAGAVVAGHNVAFDLAFLTSEFRRLGVEVPPLPAVCTHALAALLFPELERHRLADCCDHAGIVLDGAHTALGDARATARLLGAYLATARARGTVALAELGCTPLVPPPVVWTTGLPYRAAARRRGLVAPA